MGRPRAAQTGWLSKLIYRLAAALLVMVPRQVALSLGGALGYLGSLPHTRQREVVADNLRQVVGAIQPEQLTRLVRSSYASYGRYWADVAKLSSRSARHLDRRYHTKGADHVKEALKEGGVVFALPHLGSWEIGAIWAEREGFPFTTVAEDAVNEDLTRWFIERRERLGMHVLRLGSETPVTLLSELRAGRTIALLADRDVVGDGIEVPFFGRPTNVPPGPAVLALRAKATIIPCTVFQQPWGRYLAVFGPPIYATRQAGLREDVMRITRELVSVFEGFIRQAPEQWHVFQPIWPATQQLPSRTAPKR